MGVLVKMVELAFSRKQKKAENSAPSDRMVYYVPGGSCYHLYDFCLDNSEKDVIKAKEAKAIKKGLRLCKKCMNNM